MRDKAESKIDADDAKPSGTDTPGIAELGYAERRVRPRGAKAGQVGFDDQGNAQFQWDQTLLGEGAEHDSKRERALTIANLVLVDDEPPPDGRSIAVNKKGLRVGYNPYDSGRLEKQKWRKTRDLRALSKWIEAQRKLGQEPKDGDDE